jgi:multiple sugar transport system permease protein
LTAPRRQGCRGISDATRRPAKRQSEAKVGWLAVSPAVTLLIGLLFGPAAAVVLFSFTDWQLGASSFHFIGLANFASLVADPAFWKALCNNLLYVVVVVPSTVLLGLDGALLINVRLAVGGM